MHFGLISLCVTFLVFWVYRSWRKRLDNPKGLPFPPGPKPKPLLGNLKDIPTGIDQWKGYRALSYEYNSDIIYLSTLGKHILVLNSLQVATDLLDKKSAIYSDRPRFPWLKGLVGLDWNLVVMSYHEGFARHRKLVQQGFQPSVVAESYRSTMVKEVAVMLDGLLNTPERFSRHLKRMTGAIIMMATYGHQVTSSEDHFVELAERARRTAEGNPGIHIVDVLPILKYAPSWLPYQRRALAARKIVSEMLHSPYQQVKNRMASETGLAPCYVGRLLELQLSGTNIDEKIIKNCGGVVYSAGADTTATVMTNMFYAMILFPDVQLRVQEELDRVVGRNRLPSFDDRPHTPYMNCFLKEVLRWKTSVALGVPHYTARSDEYRSFFIPKGTTVLANIQGMLSDPSTYRDPEVFRPERFLQTPGHEPELDPARIVFGFGRRICPGRYFADDSVWIAIASILHVFTVSLPRNNEGRQFIPDIQWAPGLVTIPSEFPCTVKIRFQEAKTLIQLVTGEAAR